MTPTEALSTLQRGDLSQADQREAALVLARHSLDLQLELWALRGELEKRRGAEPFGIKDKLK